MYVLDKFYKVRKDIPEYFKAFNKGLHIDDDGIEQEAHIVTNACKEPTERKITNDKGNIIKTIKTFMVKVSTTSWSCRAAHQDKGGHQADGHHRTLTLIGAGLKALIYRFRLSRKSIVSESSLMKWSILMLWVILEFECSGGL